MSIVKRQHYVWRHYLRPWADNESIWAYLKEPNKIIKSDLMGVAQERYFYKLVDFTDAEENFLEKYIEHSSPQLVKDLNFDFLRLFTSTSKLKKALDATTNPAVDKEKYIEEIRKLEINLMEVGHGKMEALGQKLLTYRSLNDLKTIEQDDYLFDAIMFLCFQYFRTKSMRKSALKSFVGGKYEELANKSWNILSYVTATTLAKNVSLDPKIKFISPNHALAIHFRDDQMEKYVNKVADDALVNYLNEKVFDNADYFVFADNEEILKQINIK